MSHTPPFSFAEIMSWAFLNRYPALVLSDGSRIDAGAEGWFAYLRDLTEDRFARLQVRVLEAYLVPFPGYLWAGKEDGNDHRLQK